MTDGWVELQNVVCYASLIVSCFLIDSTAANVDLVTPINCSYRIGGSPPSRMDLAKTFHSSTQPLFCAALISFFFPPFTVCNEAKSSNTAICPLQKTSTCSLGKDLSPLAR